MVSFLFGAKFSTSIIVDVQSITCEFSVRGVYGLEVCRPKEMWWIPRVAFEADGIAALDESHLFAVNFIKCGSRQWRRKVFTVRLVRTDSVGKATIAKWHIDVSNLVESDKIEVSATVDSGAVPITLNAVFRRAVSGHHSSAGEVRLISSQRSRISPRGSADFLQLISPIMTYLRDHKPEFINMVPKLFSTVILPILNRRRVDSPLIVFQFVDLVDASSRETLETQIYLLATAIQLAKWCRKHIRSSEATRILLGQLSDSFMRIVEMIATKFGEFSHSNALNKSAQVINWLIAIGRGRNMEMLFTGILGLLSARHTPDLTTVLAHTLLVADTHITAIIGSPESHLLQKSDQIAGFVVRSTQAA
jgi:hypothetical protein